MTFPTLSDLDFFRGLLTDLQSGQGEFLLFKQYNLEGRGRVEG